MTLRKVVSACAVAALLATGSVAQAAAPLGLANSPAVRAGAPVEGQSDLRGMFERDTLVIGFVILGVVLAILALTDTWPFDDDEEVESP